MLTCVPRVHHSPPNNTHDPASRRPGPFQFDPDCFDYVLNFFQHARDEFYGTPANPGGLLAAQQQLLDGGSPTSDFGPAASQNPLLTKQAIIVLREELEYFSIPPKNGAEGTDARGIANDPLLDLKRNCGKYLLHKRNIFTALQRNVNKENNLAEQHLIDMLCMRCVQTPSLIICVLAADRPPLEMWGYGMTCDVGSM